MDSGMTTSNLRAKLLAITILYLTLTLSAIASPRDCPADMILTNNECSCPIGRAVNTDLTQPLAKFGKCSEAFLDPNFKPKTPPILWLDASDPYATGYRPKTGTIITNWYDKSGNHNHFSGKATYARALYFSQPDDIFTSTSNPLNDPTTTVFIAESSGLIKNTDVSTLLGSSDTLQDLPSNFQITLSNPAASPSANKISWELGNASSLNQDGTKNILSGITAYYPTSRLTNIFSLQSSKNSLTIYRQGSLGALNNYKPDNPNYSYVSNFAPDPNNKLVIGRNYNGAMMEIIIFSGALDDTERRAVEQYLANKWGGGPYYAKK
jgi:hypothetical protein